MVGADVYPLPPETMVNPDTTPPATLLMLMLNQL